jgi:U4/U6 small nuclear ribonucleoprotein PRP31
LTFLIFKSYHRFQVENAKNNKVLEQFLSQATIMVVSVTASTTQGVSLSDDELVVVTDSADVAVKLNEYKKKIFSYVESRMTFIAPNLSYIVGASTAAKLVSPRSNPGPNRLRNLQLHCHC